MAIILSPSKMYGHWTHCEPKVCEFQHGLAITAQRRRILKALDERGIDLEELRQATGRQEADPFDLLCFLAYGGPLVTRRERVEKSIPRIMDGLGMDD